MAKKKKEKKVESKLESKMMPMAMEVEESDEPHEYEVKEASETLLKAEEIKKNKKLMPKVHEHMKSKMDSIKSIADLKNMRSEMGMKNTKQRKGY